MNLDISNQAGNNTDWPIPKWLKILVTAFAVTNLGFLVRVLFSNQQTYFEISTRMIEFLLLVLLAVLSSISIGFWLFPNGEFSLICYSLMCLVREPASVLSLLGILYLWMIHTPLVALRGLSLYGMFLSFVFIAWRLQPTKFPNTLYLSQTRFFLVIQRFVVVVENIPSRILRIIIALLPVTIICAVIYFVFGSKLSNYGPYSFWNDEISYWVWLRSFRYVGLHSGYNAPNELPAVFGFSRYGEASPFYLYIYGVLAKLVPWSAIVPVVINFVLLTISIYWFLYVTKFDNWQIVFSGLTILCTWPVLLFLPLTSHETLNQVIGLMCAIIFIKLISERASIDDRSRVLFIALIYLATLIRLSWGLLLIPAWFYTLKGNLGRRITFSILLGAVLYISVIVLMGYMLPPINNSILGTFKAGWLNGPQIILNKLWHQSLSLFDTSSLTPNIAVVFQMIVLMGWSLWRILQLHHNGLTVSGIAQDRSLLILYTLVSLLVAGFVFYLPVGFYRTFAPTMLLLCFLLISQREYGRLAALLCVNVLMFSSYMTFFYGIGDYRVIAADYTTTDPWSHDAGATMVNFVFYDPKAINPWCNTLLIPLAYYDSRVMLVPPGIGISYIWSLSSYRLPMKSRYVWIGKETYTQIGGRTNLKKLTDLLGGTLYLNLDVQCQSAP